MGRPPRSVKDRSKKGPWTPEEDTILASYIQEHGPGNWRSVPTNTGLLRCSKSCRLRWTNYLRPGIKRGNFSTHEERMIVHLQALLGNKWASIASYLPQRTDNYIKNYWNTHLKKKIKKFQSNMDPLIPPNTSTYQFVSKRAYTDKLRSKDMANLQTSVFKLNQTSTYASSTENISIMLEGWMKSSSPKENTDDQAQKKHINYINKIHTSASSTNLNDNNVGDISLQCNHVEKVAHENSGFILHAEFESLLFQNMGNIEWLKSESSSNQGSDETILMDGKFQSMPPTSEQTMEEQPPFAFLENCLLDEALGQVD